MPSPAGPKRLTSILPAAGSVGQINNDESISPAVFGFPAQEKRQRQQPPVLATELDQRHELMCLELQDGARYQGYSFGAAKSIAGELVFQTGMVGYPESITDPSYRGQILVMTFPLIGNYGVPSRETADELLGDLPAYFESSEIHIAGLVTASYAGEDFSHFLAESSLGTWLKEQGVPAMYGVDTRALTKRIREEGSMLGRLHLQDHKHQNDKADADSDATPTQASTNHWTPSYEHVDWVDPNQTNLAAEGMG